jgi:hypothetical protein
MSNSMAREAGVHGGTSPQWERQGPEWFNTSESNPNPGQLYIPVRRSRCSTDQCKCGQPDDTLVRLRITAQCSAMQVIKSGNQVKDLTSSAVRSAARFTAIVQADRHASMQANTQTFQPYRDMKIAPASSTYRSSTDLFLQNQPGFLYSSSIMEFYWPIPAARLTPAERLRHLHRRYDSWKNTGRESIMVESGVRYPACPGTSVDDSGRDRQSDEHA